MVDPVIHSCLTPKIGSVGRRKAFNRFDTRYFNHSRARISLNYSRVENSLCENKFASR